MTAVYPHAKVVFLFNSITRGEKVCVHSATKLLWGKPAVVALLQLLYCSLPGFSQQHYFGGSLEPKAVLHHSSECT